MFTFYYSVSHPPFLHNLYQSPRIVSWEKKNIVSSIFGCTPPCCRNLWCTMHFLRIIQVHDLLFSSIPKVKYWISTNCVSVSLHINGDIVLMNQTYLLICWAAFSWCGLLHVVCLKVLDCWATPFNLSKQDWITESKCELLCN